MTRADIELDFIREFSHSGAQLGPGVSREERRERIRCAIGREQKQECLFRDTGLTYAQIYQIAYNKPLDARRLTADSSPLSLRPETATLMDEDPDESDEPLGPLEASVP